MVSWGQRTSDGANAETEVDNAEGFCAAEPVQHKPSQKTHDTGAERVG